VKRSGRDEPMWAAIHMYIEAMLGISLYSYLFLKLARILCLTYISNVSSPTKSDIRGQNRFCLAVYGGEGVGAPNNVYTCE
jgi:hypothetical protein